MATSGDTNDPGSVRVSRVNMVSMVSMVRVRVRLANRNHENIKQN